MLKSGKEINWKRTPWMKKLLKDISWGEGVPEAEFLDKIQTKVLRDFPPIAIHSLLYRNQIHNRTILLRFLDIMWRVLRLEDFIWIYLPCREGGMVFSQVFLLHCIYSVE
jgi:hypothetical protein